LLIFILGDPLSIALKNVAKMVAASLGWRFFKTRRPLNVMFAPTDRCTGSCVYCQIPKRKSPEMSLDQVQRMLDQAAALGCQRLGIWGGEPLVYKDLGAVIAHAKKLGLFVTVDTNGHLIAENDDALSMADHLNISLNGDQAAHDAQCGAGAFEKTMRGIEHARGRYRFWTITVLTQANLGQIDWLMDTAREYGFLTTFQPLHHNENLGANDSLRPDDAALREAARKLLALKRRGAPVASSTKYLRHLIRWSDYSQIRTDQPCDCPACLAGSLYCNVDVDGSLYPCSLLIDDCAAPNVKDGFGKAFAALPKLDCTGCLAGCFTEYNLLYHLDIMTGINWMRALAR
jgi:pyrroloquinoline quinone biosynthesis protein E